MHMCAKAKGRVGGVGLENLYLDLRSFWRLSLLLINMKGEYTCQPVNWTECIVLSVSGVLWQ